MSTDAAMPVDSGGGAPAPAPTTDNGEMTAAERAYFQSRGEDVAGLMGEAKPAAPAPVEQPKADAKAAPAPTAPAAEEDGEPGEIEISADGTARDTKTGKFVPKSAYLRVRDGEKQARQEASRYRDLAIAAKERLALYAEATGDLPGKAKDDTPPSPEEDIFGFAQHMAREVASLKSQIKGGETERALQSAVTHDMRAFAATEPGFVDAFGFFTQRLDSVLQAIGHDNPEVRAGEIKRQTREIVTQAMQSRRSGAAALFAAAKAMGWSAKPANDPTAEAAKAGAAELQKLTDAQKANASLRGAGTSAAPDALTPGKLADMGDAEYSRARDGYIAKHGRGAWNKLVFGG
jgi:hypothetical protein